MYEISYFLFAKNYTYIAILLDYSSTQVFQILKYWDH